MDGEMILDFMKLHKKVLLIGFLTLLLWCVANGVSNSQKRIYADVKAELDQLKSQQLMERNLASSEGGLGSSDDLSLSGTANMDRIDSDKKAIEELMDKLFTFDSMQEYMDVRDGVSYDYGEQSGDFFRYFYQSVVDDGTQGGRYDYVASKDIDYKCSLKDVESDVVSMSSSQYTYLNYVTVSDGVKDHSFVVSCMVSNDGVIGNLSGYVAK